MDGNLRFSVPSKDRLNKAEAATYSILPILAFFRMCVCVVVRACERACVRVCVFFSSLF
jgi:hypothetical protein